MCGLRYLTCIMLYSTVKDMSIKAVASNNIVAVRQKKKNLSDAAQKLKMATSKEADSRLKRYQKRVIAMNDSLLQLYMSKVTSWMGIEKYNI